MDSNSTPQGKNLYCAPSSEFHLSYWVQKIHDVVKTGPQIFINSYLRWDPSQSPCQSPCQAQIRNILWVVPEKQSLSKKISAAVCHLPLTHTSQSSERQELWLLIYSPDIFLAATLIDWFMWGRFIRSHSTLIHWLSGQIQHGQLVLGIYRCTCTLPFLES